MGCCHLVGSPQATGLVIPEQELEINQVEWQHPFHQLPLEDLLTAFKSANSSAVLTKTDFLQACAGLRVPHEDLPCCLLLEHALTTPTGTLDRKKVLLCSILLGRGSFQAKLQALLALDGRSDCSSAVLSQILRDLVHVSVQVLPQMIPLTAAHQLYLAKLKSLEMLMITTFFKTVNVCSLTSREDLISALTCQPSLQKVCWSNGVRLLLLEEDVSLTASLQAEPSAPTTTALPPLVPDYSKCRRSRHTFSGDMTADSLRLS